MKTILPILVLFLLQSCDVVYAQDVFHKCPMEGNAKDEKTKQLDRLKNRYNEPIVIDKSITLDALLADGNDSTRFDESHAASIEGYVLEVKSSGAEACGCSATKEPYVDSHIYVVKDASVKSKSKAIIVEVTPRFKAKHPDWVTSALRKSILHHTVRFTGWMMKDWEHWANAVNTNPKGKHPWRKTYWEPCHPVTGIQILK